MVSAESVAAGHGPEAVRATGGQSGIGGRRDTWAACGPEPAPRRPIPAPSASTGEKKLQDFFVDRKVARRLRDGVPLVVDDLDRIVWVAGHGIDETFRVTDASQAVIILRLRPV